MKKLLLLPLLFLSFAQAEANRDLHPRVLKVCEKNKWVKVSATFIDRIANPKHFCVLPDGNYYLILDLYSNPNDKYKELFDQYSGQQPTFEQIENTKKQIREDGYLVD